MKNTILLILSLLAYTGLAQTKTITYVEDKTDIFNPERGLYHHVETFSSNHIPLNPTDLANYKAENISIIFRLFYLNSFVTSPISAAYLTKIQEDFNLARTAGMKMILRFAYTNVSKRKAPYGDADKATILNHIAQLKPLFQANMDIILNVQAGFIGTWGEWYYTTYFGDPAIAGNPKVADYQNRKDVTEALLAAVPSDIMVSLRTPAQKQKMYTYTLKDTITKAQSYSATSKARLSYHNDCFLSSATDVGTFNSSAERKYLKEEVKYTIYGGEACAEVNNNDCVPVLDTMKAYQMTYFNDDYNTRVIDKWVDDNCYTVIKKTLGYRFVLKNSVLDIRASKGKMLTVTVQLTNVGWAPPALKKKIVLVLRNQTSGKLYPIEFTTFDWRTWKPGNLITLKLQGGIGTDLLPGTYDVLLHLKDPNASLGNRVDFSVRCANSGTWESTTGNNKLGTVTIDQLTTGVVYTGKNWFGKSALTTEEKVKLDEVISVFPNPIDENINIIINKSSNYKFDLIDTNGNTIYSSQQFLEVGEISLPTPISKPGMYMLCIQDGNEQIIQKIIKK